MNIRSSHPLFTPQAIGFFVADPLQNVVELPHRTNARADILHIGQNPKRDILLATVEVGLGIGTAAYANFVVAEDLTENRGFVSKYLIGIHRNQRRGGIRAVQTNGYIVSVVEPIMQDEHVRLRGMFLRTNQTLHGIVLDTGIAIQELRRHHAPSGEFLDDEGTALIHDDFGAIGIKAILPGNLFGKHQFEPEAQRVGIPDIVVVALDPHLGCTFAGLDGDTVREQAVVQTFDGIASLVDDLDPEGAVVAAGYGRGYRNGEVILVLEHRIGGQRVGKHDVLGIGVGLELFVTGGCQSCGQHGCCDNQYLFHKFDSLSGYSDQLLSLGWISEPGDSSSCCGIGHTKSGSSQVTLRELPSSSEQDCGVRWKL